MVTLTTVSLGGLDLDIIVDIKAKQKQHGELKTIFSFLLQSLPNFFIFPLIFVFLPSPYSLSSVDLLFF